MKLEKVKETIGKGIIMAFEKLSFSTESIHRSAQGHTIAQWRHKQEGFAGGTGAAAAIVPGLHIPALGIDIGVLINRMGECAYGIGAIIGEQKGKGNILEKEDLANILALWGGHMTVYELEKVVAEGKGGRFASSAGTGGLGTLAATSLGVIGVGGLTPAVVAAVAAQFGAKITLKAAAGWIPFVGALASAGINVWLVSSISQAAEKYYMWKADHWG